MTSIWSSWDPFEELQRVQRRLDQLFPGGARGALEGPSELPEQAGGGQLSQPLRSWRPSLDIKETDKEFVINADLPGVPKENVKVDLNDNVLSISGERHYETKEENERFHRSERHYGKFLRTVPLPAGVKAEAIDACYTNGVLEVHVQKPQSACAKQIAVNIK